MKKVLEKIKLIMSFIALDGLVHIETSALIVLLCPKCIGLWSIVIALVCGIAKELYDIFYKKSLPALSIKDFVCDVVGAVLGFLILLLK